METEERTSKAAHFLIVAACFVVVVAGMRAASSILVPFLLSMFIAIICAPPLFWMQRKGVPSRFLYYPDENHWVLSPANSVQWHETVLDWLARWLEEPRF